jgi:hypothetical protein
MNKHTHPQSVNQPGTALLVKALIRFLVLSLIMLAVLFIAAGSLQWWEAWVYTGSAILVLMISRGTMIIKNPDMVVERAEAAHKRMSRIW